MSDDAKRTMFAQRALGLAEMFQSTFGGTPIGKEVKYRAEMSAPDGPSTGGGKQSLQALKLVPVETGSTLVIGHANQVEGSAELRTYEYMVRWQQQRFKGQGELLLDRALYDELLQKLKTFLSANGMRVTVQASPKPSGEVRPASAGAASNLPMILIGVAVGAVILLGLILFLRH